ncbi:ankyrin, partial [Coemansia reversa NRRL 1564]
LALHSAVSRGDIGSICYALLGGQPIDSLCDGLQPIHVAATQDDPAVIEMLLQNGADPNARSVAATKPAPHTSLPCPDAYHGATPLHFAVAGARVACVEALLRGGACTDAADSFGNTPASIAAACGDMQIVSII